MQNLISALLIALLLLSQSCSTTIEETQKNRPTVIELYQQGSHKHINHKRYKSLGLNSAYVRQSENELENRFPRLPNPVLNMFVYPHLISNAYPVPGYTTNFRLYEVDQYALPSETY